MDNVRGLLGFRRLDRVPIANIRELCGAMMGWIDKSVLQLFGHIERMENDRIVKKGICENL